MDNVLDLDGFKKVTNVTDVTYGNFVRELKNKYGNRNPPMMVNTIDNFNNEGLLAQAGGPSEGDIWFVYIESESTLYIKPSIKLSGI